MIRQVIRTGASSSVTPPGKLAPARTQVTRAHWPVWQALARIVGDLDAEIVVRVNASLRFFCVAWRNVLMFPTELWNCVHPLNGGTKRRIHTHAAPATYALLRAVGSSFRLPSRCAAMAALAVLQRRPCSVVGFVSAHRSACSSSYAITSGGASHTFSPPISRAMFPPALRFGLRNARCSLRLFLNEIKRAIIWP